VGGIWGMKGEERGGMARCTGRKFCNRYT
jgi:hypothetical protein